MTECPEFLIYKDNDAWRVVCSDGRMYKQNGLYETKEQAIEAVKTTGCPYQVVEGRTTYELF